MTYSRFGERFGAPSGIRALMDDLGHALQRDRSLLMLGGGNPAPIPEMTDVFRRRLREVADDDRQIASMLGDYSAPQGHAGFIDALADMFAREFGWPITADNIALTAGSQTGFFMLFNLLAGDTVNGRKRILLPLTPEYIGYTSAGLTDPFFAARRPTIEMLDEGYFKYRVDFDHLDVGFDIAAICVSRPTNPTGNVLTDNELARLDRIARERDIPLIIDNAYGTPFPHIIFTDAKPVWNENVILTMSLSKLGLPAARTGIVVARPEIIDAVISMTAVISLGVSSVGPALLEDLVASGEIIRLSHDVIQPYYRRRRDQAVDWVRGAFGDTPVRIHKPEGSMFLWLWFPDLPIDSQTLYERLVKRGVLVIPGHHFYPGLKDDWRHRHECIRVNYGSPEDVVERGLAIIAEEVTRAYA